jgi:hypothetical protein
METLKDDTNGQWILFSGFVVAISLVVVAVLFNQINISGYYASNAVLEFPKEDLRELSLQSRLTTQQAYGKAVVLSQTSNDTTEQILGDLLKSYNAQMSRLYGLHGKTVGIELANITYATSDSTQIENIWINISYYDGNTYYSSEPEIVEVNR